MLTDGEETCGGNPCTLGKRLHAESDLYIGVESEDDLAKALEKTLGCPMLSDRTFP